jgi:hypothetical protein
MMTEAQMKVQLRRMLRSLTAGSLLHLLAQLFRESADRPQSRENQSRGEKSREVAATLFVVGLGVDAVSPRPFDPL